MIGLRIRFNESPPFVISHPDFTEINVILASHNEGKSIEFEVIGWAPLRNNEEGDCLLALRENLEAGDTVSAEIVETDHISEFSKAEFERSRAEKKHPGAGILAVEVTKSGMAAHTFGAPGKCMTRLVARVTPPFLGKTRPPILPANLQAHLWVPLQNSIGPACSLSDDKIDLKLGEHVAFRMVPVEDVKAVPGPDAEPRAEYIFAHIVLPRLCFTDLRHCPFQSIGAPKWTEFCNQIYDSIAKECEQELKQPGSIICRLLNFSGGWAGVQIGIPSASLQGEASEVILAYNMSFEMRFFTKEISAGGLVSAILGTKPKSGFVIGEWSLGEDAGIVHSSYGLAEDGGVDALANFVAAILGGEAA